MKHAIRGVLPKSAKGTARRLFLVHDPYCSIIMYNCKDVASGITTNLVILCLDFVCCVVLVFFLLCESSPLHACTTVVLVMILNLFGGADFKGTWSSMLGRLAINNISNWSDGRLCRNMMEQTS